MAFDDTKATFDLLTATEYNAMITYIKSVISSSGNIGLSTPTELTIATGAITKTATYHTVDTEADAASDDLDTISGGTVGDILILNAADAARTVVLKDGTGNLSLGNDVSLDEANDSAMLLYNGTNWVNINKAIIESSGALNNVVEDTTPQLGGQLDVNGNAIGDGTLELLSFVETASAVNHVQITNNSTGNHPEVAAVGDDANINLTVAAKGTGVVDVTSRLDYDNAVANVSALGNLGATETIDWDTASYFEGTLDSNVTVTHSNEVSGQRITLALAYDGSAQRTITWSDVDKWAGGTAPSTPSASGEVLVVTMVFLGSTCYASADLFS